MTQAIRRDIDGLRQTCFLFNSLTSQHKSPFWNTHGRFSHALLASIDEPSSQTANELRDAIEHWQSVTRSPTISLPYWWAGFLAEIFLSIDDCSSALDAIEKGFKIAETSIYLH